MIVSSLTERITFQSRTKTKVSGTYEYGEWKDVIKVWANVYTTAFQDNDELNTKAKYTTIFKIWRRDGLKRDMQIVFDGNEYSIDTVEYTPDGLGITIEGTALKYGNDI